MRTANHRSTARDPIHLGMSPRRDRETREELHAILRTHLALESTTTLRQFLVHLLAAIAGLIVLLWMWALCCLAAVISAAAEWRLHTEEARLLARNQPSERLVAEDGR